MTKKPNPTSAAATSSPPAASASPAAAPVRRGMTPLKKITVESVYGKISVKDLPVLFEADGVTPNAHKEMFVCRIGGFASNVKTGVSTYGAWTMLEGEFSAINPAGEVFMASVCAVPGAMGDALTTATHALNPGEQIRFVVNVCVSRSPREPGSKYVYTVRPELEIELGAPSRLLLGV